MSDGSEPRRPVPAYLQTVNTSVDKAARMGAGSSTTAASLADRLRSSRAMGKAKEAWRQSSDYIAPRIDRAATSFEAKIKGIDDPSTLPRIPTGSRVRDSTRNATLSTARSDSWWSTLSGPASATSTGARATSAATNETKDSAGEERVVLFNGWSVLRPSVHAAVEPALVIEVQAHGYCYRLRPMSQASRTTRALYGMAKSFAALPSIPPNLRPEGSLDEPKSNAKAASSAESLARELEFAKLADSDESSDDIYRNMEKLLELGGQASEAPLDQDVRGAFSDEPLPMNSASSSDAASLRSSTTGDSLGPSRQSTMSTQTDSSASILSEPAKVKRQPHAQGPPGAAKGPTYMTAVIAPLRSSTMPPAASHDSTESNSSSQASHDWPKAFAFEESDLPRLHANLQDRLTPFFGQNLANRKVRLSIFPSLGPGRLWDKALATKVVTTGPRGGFSTVMSVRSKELRRLLEEIGTTKGSLDEIDLQIKAELLEQDKLADALGGGGLTNHIALRAVATDEAETSVSKDAGVRVISDIDDTIKWTEVLGGTKAIFRNVFVREETDIRIPGMSEWYEAMKRAGASFSYVSNSPVQLWPVLRSFLRAAAFPLGSVTLKEYGGASSALAKLWEEPGARKREGLVAILEEFKESKFILVGDSGEQDLQVYVSLACQYPSQVIGIFIRDCTTPFRPNAHPDLTTPSTGSGSGGLGSSRGPRAQQLRSSTLSSASRSQPSTPPASKTSVLWDSDVDPLSPNNPLRPEPGLPGTLPAVEAFYAKIATAERTLPKHIPLRIFRHGREVLEEGVALVVAHKDS